MQHHPSKSHQEKPGEFYDDVARIWMIALPAYAAAVRSNARFAEALQVRGSLELRWSPNETSSHAAAAVARRASTAELPAICPGRFCRGHDTTRNGTIEQVLFDSMSGDDATEIATVSYASMHHQPWSPFVEEIIS